MTHLRALNDGLANIPADAMHGAIVNAPDRRECSLFAHVSRTHHDCRRSVALIRLGRPHSVRLEDAALDEKLCGQPRTKVDGAASKGRNLLRETNLSRIDPKARVN